MKLTTLLLIVFSISSFVSNGQKTTDSLIKSNCEKVEDFVPENWKILQQTTGDLNKDKINDVALIIQATDTSKIGYLIGEEEEKYTVDIMIEYY